MRARLHTWLTRLRLPGPYRLPLVILGAVLLLTLLAPLLAPADPLLAIAGEALQPPDAVHLLGTDTLGRDVLSRWLWGGQQTLTMALLAALIAILPGLVIGLTAGYVGGWLERALMAGMDALLAFPNLLLALALITLLGSGLGQIAVAVGIAGLPAYARVARVAISEVRTQPYVEAAYAVGVPGWRILLWHVLPNAMDKLLSFGAVSLSWGLLNGAALTFLGFGGDPATPDWGAMLNEGRAAFRVAPWIAFPPGLAITLTLYAVNRLADAWQDQAPAAREATTPD